ncbi:hypothetical protein ACJMK2_018467 [Sinanodonta woodiana]|uniref:SAM domain-containing protein n=1 Tax=Sinanodonta woodiana TaxID=1069815 RepID=A0ABD3UDJ3_SINWO
MKSREVARKTNVYRQEYENFKPLMLPKITELSGSLKPSSFVTNKSEKNSVSKTLPVEDPHQMSNGGQKSANMQDGEQQINRRQDVTPSFSNQPHLNNKWCVAKDSDCIEDGLNIIRRPKTSAKPLKSPPHPQRHADADYQMLPSYEQQKEQGIPSQIADGTPAPVKQRLPICTQPDMDRSNIDTDSESTVYENIMIVGKVGMPTENTSLRTAASMDNDKPQCQDLQRIEITNVQPRGVNGEMEHDENSLIYENLPLQMPTKVGKGMTESNILATMTAGTDDLDKHDRMVPSALCTLDRERNNLGFSTRKQNEIKQNSNQTVAQKADNIQIATEESPLSAKSLIVNFERKFLAQDDYRKTFKANKDMPRDAVKKLEGDRDSPVSTVFLDSDVKLPPRKSTKAKSEYSPIQSTQLTSSVSHTRQLQNEPSQLQFQGQVCKDKPINVEQLNVNQLGAWMTEKLRLGKYVSHFAEELIDGALLMNLEEDILITYFGFSVLEAKRLKKFATEGFISQ